VNLPRHLMHRQLVARATESGWTWRVLHGWGSLPVLDPDRPHAGDGTRPKVYVLRPCGAELLQLKAPDGRRAVAYATTLDGRRWTGQGAWLWTPPATLLDVDEIGPKALRDLITPTALTLEASAA
jgi:hypothetical protein